MARANSGTITASGLLMMVMILLMKKRTDSVTGPDRILIKLS